MARKKKEYIPECGDKVKFTNNRNLTRIATFVGFHIPELSNPDGVWSFFEVDIDGTVLKGYSLNQIKPHKAK